MCVCCIFIITYGCSSNKYVYLAGVGIHFCSVASSGFSFDYTINAKKFNTVYIDQVSIGILVIILTKLLLSIIFRTLIYVDDSSLQHHYTEASLCRKYADKELFAWFRTPRHNLHAGSVRVYSFFKVGVIPPWYWRCNFSWTNIVMMLMQFTCGLIKIL